MPVYIVKVVAGREEITADIISSRVKREKIGVFSIIVPHDLKGYIFLEAEGLDEVYRAIYGIANIKGVIRQAVPEEQLANYLTPAKEVADVNPGDIVEIIAGPFKGYQAKVEWVNKKTGEVSLVLLDSVVPIPITYKLDAIKVVKRRGEGGEEGSS